FVIRHLPTLWSYLSPYTTLFRSPVHRAEMQINLVIHRKASEVFRGQTNLDQMKRTFDDLIDWLFRDNSFPDGVVLLTGTGIVPRSEEHTSELQSLRHLVCRLLLE